MKRTHGFTLVELLIVVAILGILTVIAVPNFQAAMIRARVARTQADMNMIAKAIENLRIERGVLLVDKADFNMDWGKRRVMEQLYSVGYKQDGQNRTHLDILAPLTSPIPYLSQVPEDYYQKMRIQHREEGFIYENWLVEEPDGYNYFYYSTLYPALPIHIHPHRRMIGPYSFASERLTGRDGIDYYLHGSGPDLSLPPFSVTFVPYAASNGLYSRGDIMYYPREGVLREPVTRGGR